MTLSDLEGRRAQKTRVPPLNRPVPPVSGRFDRWLLCPEEIERWSDHWLAVGSRTVIAVV